MNILVVGGGGREHAIIQKLRENPAVTRIYALPGNGGIAADAVCVPIGAKDIPAITSFAVSHGVEFAVVGPDDPLALGCADALRAAGVPCFGPGARAAVRSIMEERIFGASGSEIVVEEFLTGPEVSVLAFTDGTAIAPMVSSMDHKRARDGDEGPNTGGMGTIAPNPFYTPEIARVCRETIFLPTLAAMRAEGCPFAGCLYFGLMLTAQGPRVIEYNCRFGDPETQVVLPLLKSDLLTVMQAVEAGTLADCPVEWREGAAACVVLASGGYPGKYDTGKPIALPPSLPANVTVYHAGDALRDGRLVTAGGRVLGVTAAAPTLAQAIGDAYAAAETIHFDGAYLRRDIGRRALAAQEG
jgi:phosphoribosylamine--glycine ligase